MNYKEQIRAHIAKGETEKAIALLMEFTHQEDSPFKDDAVLISSQYRQWKREVNLGIDQSSTDLRRIELSIMEMLNQKPTPTPAVSAQPVHVAPPVASPSNPNKKYMIYGGIGLILIVLIFALLDGGGDDFDEALSIDNIAVDDSQFNSDPTIDEFQEKSGEVTVNASNVVKVTYLDNSGNETGEYVQTEGTTIWVENKLPSHQLVSFFREEERDATSVYLYNEERDVSIRLDIENGGVWYYKGEDAERQINRISTWSGPSTITIY